MNMKMSSKMDPPPHFTKMLILDFAFHIPFVVLSNSALTHLPSISPLPSLPQPSAANHNSVTTPLPCPPPTSTNATNQPHEAQMMTVLSKHLMCKWKVILMLWLTQGYPKFRISEQMLSKPDNGPINPPPLPPFTIKGNLWLKRQDPEPLEFLTLVVPLEHHLLP